MSWVAPDLCVCGGAVSWSGGRAVPAHGQTRICQPACQPACLLCLPPPPPAGPTEVRGGTSLGFEDALGLARSLGRLGGAYKPVALQLLKVSGGWSATCQMLLRHVSAAHSSCGFSLAACGAGAAAGPAGRGGRSILVRPSRLLSPPHPTPPAAFTPPATPAGPHCGVGPPTLSLRLAARRQLALLCAPPGPGVGADGHPAGAVSCLGEGAHGREGRPPPRNCRACPFAGCACASSHLFLCPPPPPPAVPQLDRVCGRRHAAACRVERGGAGGGLAGGGAAPRWVGGLKGWGGGWVGGWGWGWWWWWWCVCVCGGVCVWGGG